MHIQVCPTDGHVKVYMVPRSQEAVKFWGQCFGQLARIEAQGHTHTELQLEASCLHSPSKPAPYSKASLITSGSNLTAQISDCSVISCLEIPFCYFFFVFVCYFVLFLFRSAFKEPLVFFSRRYHSPASDC